MTRRDTSFRRRTVLKTIGGTAVASGAFAGVSAASGHCDATVSSGDSIQAAINAATPGDTICVEAGTYDEAVVVDKANLTLQGPNAGTHGASGNRAGEAIIERGVEVAADGVTLDGLQVENDGQDGVAVKEPVSDVTVENNRVTNVTGVSHSFGGAGNGVNIQPLNSGTVDGIAVKDNEISGVGAPDPDPRAKGVDVRVSWGKSGIQITNTEVRGNVIGDIETDTSSAGRAIGVHADVNGGGSTIEDLTVAENEITDLTGGDATAVFLTETPGFMSDPRVGPTDFAVTENDIDDLAPQGGQAHALFVGGYEEFGDHEVTLNNFRDGAVERWDQSQDGFDPANADTLLAECNWWGHATGPEDDDNRQGRGVPVVGDVDYRPWLVRAVGTGRKPRNSCVGGKNANAGKGRGPP